jgi:hypothetical protein
MRAPRFVRVAACVAAWLVLPSVGTAQQRPLVTEDPETVGAGLVLIEAGLDYAREQFYPASGLQGNLLRLPVVGVSLGVSSIAEIQFDAAVYNRLSITDRFSAPLAHLVTATEDRTTGLDNVVVATKVRLLSEAEGRPAVGVRLATKLPAASRESGIGVDTTDFHVVGLVGKTVQSIRLVGNFGLGWLGDPLGGGQEQAWLYGVSLARAVAEGLEVVGEINGRANGSEGEVPVGTESGAMMRLGTRLTRGTARVDAGLLLGMTSRDPSIGFTVGVTYVFRGFSVP